MLRELENTAIKQVLCRFLCCAVIFSVLFFCAFMFCDYIGRTHYPLHLGVDGVPLYSADGVELGRVRGQK
jgi:hypothetical protein